MSNEILDSNKVKLETMNKNSPMWNILKTVDAILRELINKRD